MDNIRFGTFLAQLRKEQGLTQRELAGRLNVTDKAVSRWETGLGCPDVSLLSEVSRVLGVKLETLLSGELDANDQDGGNMKKLRFYVCPQCGNLLTSAAEAEVSCCGRPLSSLEPKKAEGPDLLSVESIDGNWFVSSPHPMTKEHYVSFVALLTGDSVMIRRLYPEWDLQTRLPFLGHGVLLWYCTQHGLFQQLI